MSFQGASLSVLFPSRQHVQSLHPFTFQLVESEEVDSSQVRARACGGPTSENTRELSRRADCEEPGVWDFSLQSAGVVANVTRFPLQAEDAAPTERNVL